jgi:hypothetical protein
VRALRAALVVALGAGSAGCFQMATTIAVNGDSSGTIVQRLVLSRAALGQLRQFGGLGAAGDAAFDPLSEQQARADAARIGPGVTFVSSTPITDAMGNGRETTYAFQDLGQLRIGQQPGGQSALAFGSGGAAQAITFGFEALPNGNRLMTVHVPATLPALTGSGDAMPRFQLPPPEQISVLRQLFAGGRLAIAVQPAGTLVKTSSPFADGSRVTLVDIDLDTLLSESVLKRLNDAHSADEMKAALSDAGLKIIMDPDVTIEFTPAARD